MTQGYNEIYKNGSYLKKHPTWHEEDSPWKAKHIKTLIEHNSLNPTKICEVGCGSGEVLNQLSEQLSGEIEFFGYEISPQAFALCNKKSKNNLMFFLKDVLEENDVQFDIIMAIDVFEHVEDYFAFLRKLRDKGKYKIFHIPLDLSVQKVLRPATMIKCRQSMGHLHLFTKETAMATLEDTGYEIIDYVYTASALELPNRGWKAMLLRLPRKLLYSMSQDLAVRILGGYSLLVLAK
jgi:cyclopropane fatty-acyl-phospholipid synthase-like methyltransferase